MPQFEAAAHVLWELLFPLGLPPHAFLTWEPDEEIALCDPRPSVGDLIWKRWSDLLRPDEFFRTSDRPIMSFLSMTTLLLLASPQGMKYLRLNSRRVLRVASSSRVLTAS